MPVGKRHAGQTNTHRQQRDEGKEARFFSDNVGTNRSAVPKLAFPTFDGTNPHIWKSKCVDFFHLYNVPDTMKATIASVHMDEKSSKWLHVYKQKYGIGIGSSLSQQ